MNHRAINFVCSLMHKAKPSELVTEEEANILVSQVISGSGSGIGSSQTLSTVTSVLSTVQKVLSAVGQGLSPSGTGINSPPPSPPSSMFIVVSTNSYWFINSSVALPVKRSEVIEFIL